MARLVEHGERPCRTCGKPHKCYAEGDGRHEQRSWADPEDGHTYDPISWEQVARMLADKHDDWLVELELPELDRAKFQPPDPTRNRVEASGVNGLGAVEGQQQDSGGR